MSKAIIGVILILVGLLLLRAACHAQDFDRPAVGPELADQWTPQTRLLLAQALVGEAGWILALDHSAIPWTLYRRWQARGGTFHATITTYCRALTNGKHPWLLELDAAGTKPGTWPRSVRWRRHKASWLAVYAHVGAWGRGEVIDPCGADHWAGPLFPVRRGLHIVCDGITLNNFFVVRAL